ncbi:serine/threonine-protein kinase [Actinomadura macra]|uniref:serine/threonine-protein kinase n=1 Tax=Actinomadura macra TaxID=46164 RepID=UPI000835984B|nr:serine/threonine-protein kinase [Actinomadura macra]
MGNPSAAGRYRIDRLLGSGGFATVWLGHDPELDAPVAVKILGDSWTHRADVRERFVQEARLLRRADSHRLVQVFDIGELPDGRPYFVMTYADRGTLEDRLAGGPLPLNEALRTAREIILGVRELHGLDVVHRDLKPSNVLLRAAPGGDGERIMIADLGIARTGDRLSSLTLPAGSPGYMAPEQAQIDGAPDRRADVYGLGALTYHLLTGEPPHSPAEAPSRLRPSVPPSVDAAVLRALEPDRERRWASAEEFGHALARATSKIDTDPLPAPAGRPPGRLRRRTVLAGVGAATAALLAGGAFWAFAGLGDDGSAAGKGDLQARWLRADSDIPRQYRELIVRAGTWCDMRGLSPALIAAMLKAESGFDPRLADPVKDEYGIARWTPKLLVFWQPGGLNNPEPKPADITPELSIPAMGRYLCYWGKDLKDVPGDPSLNLAVTYRSSSKTVVKAGGVPERFLPYAEKVRRYVTEYQPR